MKILNFGSLNLDHQYQVEHFVQPGQTLAASTVTTGCGGKGLNQSIALARAGAHVWQGGCIGQEGAPLAALLQKNGVDISCLRQVDVPQGHAIIQRDKNGENCILLFGGSNRAVTPGQIRQTLDAFGPGDMLVLQNEINGLPELLEGGHARGMTVVLNPSPCEESLARLDLSYVDWLILNEGEAYQISGADSPDAAWQALHRRWPNMRVVLTLGSAGSLLFTEQETLQQPACRVQAADTTGAGDTFTGYFLACLARGDALQHCLAVASKAAALSVMKKGAADSIPTWEEVQAAQRSVY